jgi:hypothetical protein
MNTLRGITKRVISRKGRIGRIWAKNGRTARSENRLSSRTIYRRGYLQQGKRYLAARIWG